MASKSWSLDFMLSPRKFIGKESYSELKQVDFTINQFQDQDGRFDSSARVNPTAGGMTTSMRTSLVFRSIGYKSVPIQGMPGLGIQFDERTGIIPNDHYGRITRVSNSPGESHAPDVLPGMYCAGWVKRGPAGVIANTMEDAFATAEAIASDWENRRPFLPCGHGWESVSSQAKSQGLRPVSWDDWLKIDAAERDRGQLKGKEREKLTNIPEMLAALG